MLREQFMRHSFELVFDYEPNTHHDTPWGSFDLHDGVLTGRNPNL
jgi:hypothetical protein